jgi:hypothetical protein
LSLLTFGNDVFRRVKIENDLVTGFETVVNRAVFDVQMLGFAGVSPGAVKNSKEKVLHSFKQLSLTDQAFAESLSRATDHRSRLTGRLRTWSMQLANLGLEVPLSNRLPEN